MLSTRSLAVPLCFLKPDVNVASTKKPHIQKCMPGELSGHDHTASTGTHGLPGECLEAAFTSTRPQWSWNRVGGALCTVHRLVSVGRHPQPGSYEAQGAASLRFSFSWWPRLVDFWSVSPGFFIDSTGNLISSPYLPLTKAQKQHLWLCISLHRTILTWRDHFGVWKNWHRWPDLAVRLLTGDPIKSTHWGAFFVNPFSFSCNTLVAGNGLKCINITLKEVWSHLVVVFLLLSRFATWRHPSSHFEADGCQGQKIQ